jgi:hypothetical protein
MATWAATRARTRTPSSAFALLLLLAAAAAHSTIDWEEFVGGDLPAAVVPAAKRTLLLGEDAAAAARLVGYIEQVEMHVPGAQHDDALYHLVTSAADSCAENGAPGAPWVLSFGHFAGAIDGAAPVDLPSFTSVAVAAVRLGRCRLSVLGVAVKGMRHAKMNYEEARNLGRPQLTAYSQAAARTFKLLVVVQHFPGRLSDCQTLAAAQTLFSNGSPNNLQALSLETSNGLIALSPTFLEYTTTMNISADCGTTCKGLAAAQLRVYVCALAVVSSSELACGGGAARSVTDRLRRHRRRARAQTRRGGRTPRTLPPRSSRTGRGTSIPSWSWGRRPTAPSPAWPSCPTALARAVAAGPT